MGSFGLSYLKRNNAKGLTCANFGEATTKFLSGEAVRLRIATLALVGTTHFAQAQMTGNELYQNCSGQDPMEVGLCYGFIEGVFFDTADLLPLCGYEAQPTGNLGTLVFSTFTLIRPRGTNLQTGLSLAR